MSQHKKSLLLCFLALILLSSCAEKSSEEQNQNAPVVDNNKSQTPSKESLSKNGSLAEVVPVIDPPVILEPPIELPPIVLPPVGLPLHPFYPVRFPGGGGGGSRRREGCGNNVQEVNLTPTRCSGLLYGVVQEIGEGTTYTLVRIDENTGALTDVGELDLSSDLPNIDRIAGIDFDASSNLILLAGDGNTVQRYSIDCNDASIIFSTPIYESSDDLVVDGLTIDTQGLAFTIINDNNNFGERLVKFGYENVMNLDTYVLDPTLMNIPLIANFLGLGAIGFPSPDILHTLDDDNDCIINKNTRATTCNAIASFLGFPMDFVFGYVDALDQNYETLISYAIVVDSNSQTRYLASVNFATHVLTYVATIGDSEVVALAVNQTYEECDQITLMEGTACENCLIIEADCDDEIDNDMNGATDCEDTVCSSNPHCIEFVL